MMGSSDAANDRVPFAEAQMACFECELWLGGSYSCSACRGYRLGLAAGRAEVQKICAAGDCTGYERGRAEVQAELKTDRKEDSQ